jgi:hypothetical protein
MNMTTGEQVSCASTSTPSQKAYELASAPAIQFDAYTRARLKCHDWSNPPSASDGASNAEANSMPESGDGGSGSAAFVSAPCLDVAQVAC